MNRIILFLMLLGILSPVYAADSYQEQLRQFKLIYIEMLEKKVEKIPANTTVEVFLKDGTSVKGTFIEYSPYSDKLWIRPLDGKWGVFSNEAYNIRQIQTVTILVLRSI